MAKPKLPYVPLKPGDKVVVRGGVWHGWTATLVAHVPEAEWTTIRRPADVRFPGRDEPIRVPAVKRAKP